MVYEVQKLNPAVRGIIQKHKLDKDGNGKIDDKELPSVLARGVKERKGNIGTGILVGLPVGFGAFVAAGGLMDTIGEILTGGWMPLSKNHPMYDKAPIQGPVGVYIERNYKHPKMVKIGKFLNGSSKHGDKYTIAMAAIAGLAVLGTCIYEAINDKDLYTERQNRPTTPRVPQQKDNLKTKFSDGFKQLGVEDGTELKKYTPKRGENWSGILKAKYGTDDATAMSMAHRIKDVIYGDSLASKQTPIMYLPQTWKFNGKSYNYNDTAAVISGRTGGNVQTEMGKMNKNIKY